MTNSEDDLIFTRTRALINFIGKHKLYPPNTWTVQIEKDCQGVVIHTYGRKSDALEEAKEVNDILEENYIRVNAYGMDNLGKIFFDVALDNERSPYFIQQEYEREINCLQIFLATIKLPDGCSFHVICSNEQTLQIQIVGMNWYPPDDKTFWEICKKITNAGFIIAKTEDNHLWEPEIHVKINSPYFNHFNQAEEVNNE